MYDPALLWRATDFWREGLRPAVRADITRYNTWQDAHTRKLATHSPNYARIEQARTAQSLPAEFFEDVGGWFWSVKEDGYLVSLSRDGDGKWSMHLRSGTKLTPPRGFLEGLERNTRLPPVMVGELVTCFTGCDADDRGHTGRRTVLRNEQFALIHRVIERGADPLSWVGLRVKVFAFPLSAENIWGAYNTALDVMCDSLHDHPHIGLCRAGLVSSTQDAIDVFTHVVQLGLEGIVIVDKRVTYGTLARLNDHDEDAGTFFKLKQKIVLPGAKFEKTGRERDVWKDGTKHTEHAFTTKIDDEDVRFTDRIGKETGHARLKYMEHAPGLGDTFPCQSGYRHTHFAQRDDMSVLVRAASVSRAPIRVRNILGVDDDVGRILNWDVAEDREKLERSLPVLRLYNPRPFRAADIRLRPEPPIAEPPDAIEDPEPAPAKRPRPPTLATVGRTSHARDYDPRTHPAPAGGTASAPSFGALLSSF